MLLAMIWYALGVIAGYSVAAVAWEVADHAGGSYLYTIYTVRIMARGLATAGPLVAAYVIAPFAVGLYVFGARRNTHRAAALGVCMGSAILVALMLLGQLGSDFWMSAAFYGVIASGFFLARLARAPTHS
jgi:hypothetical protein